MKAVKTRIIGIYGLMGSGKSMMACVLWSLYRRIYSNMDISRFSGLVSNRIHSVRDMERIKFSTNKGVLILDESGINANSRRSSSDDNLEYGKIAMLSRKKNIDIFVIAQLDYSADKYLRDLSEITFHMNSYFWEGGLMFSAMVKNRFGQIMGEKNFEMLRYLEMTGYNYSTFEESIIKDSRSNERENTIDEILQLPKFDK